MSTDPSPTSATPAPTAAEVPARRTVVARVGRLGAEDAADDLSATTTAVERVELVQRLSRRMWELTGRPWPEYRRSAMPGRVVRLSTGEP